MEDGLENQTTISESNMFTMFSLGREKIFVFRVTRTTNPRLTRSVQKVPSLSYSLNRPFTIAEGSNSSTLLYLECKTSSNKWQTSGSTTSGRSGMSKMSNLLQVCLFFDQVWVDYRSKVSPTSQQGDLVIFPYYLCLHFLQFEPPRGLKVQLSFQGKTYYTAIVY